MNKTEKNEQRKVCAFQQNNKRKREKGKKMKHLNPLEILVVKTIPTIRENSRYEHA